MAPALDAPVMDLQLPAGLPTRRADAPPAAQPHGHDHRLGVEADVDDGRPGQAEQPLECGGDAHVVLLQRPLISNNQQPPAEDGGASPRTRANSRATAPTGNVPQPRAERGHSGRPFTHSLDDTRLSTGWALRGRGRLKREVGKVDGTGASSSLEVGRDGVG